MPKKRRSCKNNPDSFCYICGELTLLNINPLLLNGRASEAHTRYKQ